MAKLLNTTFLVTQSAPSTPSSGFGTLFASSRKLYFKNTSGATYDLTAAGGSGGYTNILVYTSSANWTKQSGLQYIKVICAGAGGGGGSGRVAGVGTTTAGGQGGCGGNINVGYFSASALLGDTYTVNVGTGGPGGARRTSNAVLAGLTGTAGISSSFATGSGASFTRLISALGGPGGLGGAATGGTGANALPTTAQVRNPYPPFYFCGVDGSIDAAGPTNAANALSGTRWLAGGGTGGRIFNTEASSSGGSGSAIYSYNTLIQSGSPSAAASGLPGDNGAPVLDVAQLLYYSGSNITTGVRIGTGGHGGGSGNRNVSPPANGGNGGSGSLGAGGGGGGGAATALNAIFSGAGGLGGDGFIIIFEYY
jgi:hypothetical protein